jgi:hypothetical protein
MLLSGLRRSISSSLSSRGSSSRFGDNGSQDSPWSLSLMPLLHRTAGSSYYPAHVDIPEATDSDHISICTTEEMEKYKSRRHQEFAHTRVYDVNILGKAGLDEELPTILQTVGCGKPYDEPHLGLCLLTLEFVMTFKIVEKNRKSFMKFHLFGKSFGCDFYYFSELLDFSKSCLLESSAMRNFNKVEFSHAISGTFTRLRFSDIHNPSLRFFHRWISFTIFPMAECRFIATLSLNDNLLW